MRVNSGQENSAGVTEKHIHKLGVYADLRTGLVEGCGLEIVDKEGALSSGHILRGQREHVCAHTHTHMWQWRRAIMSIKSRQFTWIRAASEAWRD